MKVKLDENLPRSVVSVLAAAGFDVDTVEDEGLAGRADPDVWAAAQLTGRLLVTQDLDFSDLRRFVPGTHAGLLLVRLHAPGRSALARRIEGLFALEEAAGWSGCFVVATDHRVRVRDGCADQHARGMSSGGGRRAAQR